MDKTFRMLVLALIVANFISIFIITTISSNLHGQSPKLGSTRYEMIQGKSDRSQLFIFDTNTGRFWYIDYWGLPQEEPRISGPYDILED